jgi:hypothetical protein
MSCRAIERKMSGFEFGSLGMIGRAVVGTWFG